MKYNTDAYSDVGIKKTVNQDALLIKQANSRDRGRICMACLCDGMGGLSCGEVASATFIDRMDNWFREELPAALVTENVTMQLNAVSEENFDCWTQYIYSYY